MSASIQPLDVVEFLAWERAQPLRYEFDGIQPVAMTGGSTSHARLISRLVIALGTRVSSPCEVFATELKVITSSRVRYPDVTVACGSAGHEGDDVVPTIVCEVVSPSSALTDRRVKALEYQGIESVQVYLVLDYKEPLVTVRRRSSGWVATTINDRNADLDLPEIQVSLPVAELYR